MRLLAVFCFALAACSGSNDLTSFTGAYSISEWTENPAACDSPGPSILSGQQDHGLMVKNVDFLGQKFVDVATCLDTEECNRFLADNTIHLPHALDGGNDHDGWTGDTVIAFDTATACSGEVIHAILTGEGDGVSLRLEDTMAPDFARDASGMCTTDNAKAAVTLVPCGSVQIITGVP